MNCDTSTSEAHPQPRFFARGLGNFSGNSSTARFVVPALSGRPSLFSSAVLSVLIVQPTPRISISLGVSTPDVPSDLNSGLILMTHEVSLTTQKGAQAYLVVA